MAGGGWMDSIFFQTLMPFRISEIYGSDHDFVDRLNFAPTSGFYIVTEYFYTDQ